jgi:hypothetical protein
VPVDCSITLNETFINSIALEGGSDVENSVGHSMFVVVDKESEQRISVACKSFHTEFSVVDYHWGCTMRESLDC